MTDVSPIYAKLGRLTVVALLILSGWFGRVAFEQVVQWRMESRTLKQLIEMMQQPQPATKQSSTPIYRT